MERKLSATGIPLRTLQESLFLGPLPPMSATEAAVWERAVTDRQARQSRIAARGQQDASQPGFILTARRRPQSGVP
jgi:hypothetical protein